MKRRMLFIMIGAVLLLVLGAACTNNANQNAPANTGGNAGNAGTAGNQGAVSANAENIYKQNCVGCHAADLAGGVGPNLQKVGGSMSTEQIHAKIADGGGGMPGFKNSLSEADITALTEWLASHK